MQPPTTKRKSREDGARLSLEKLSKRQWSHVTEQEFQTEKQKKIIEFLALAQVV